MSLDRIRYRLAVCKRSYYDSDETWTFETDEYFMYQHALNAIDSFCKDSDVISVDIIEVTYNQIYSRDNTVDNQ